MYDDMRNQLCTHQITAVASQSPIYRLFVEQFALVYREISFAEGPSYGKRFHFTQSSYAGRLLASGMVNN